jgi:hypothetical protein
MLLGWIKGDAEGPIRTRADSSDNLGLYHFWEERNLTGYQGVQGEGKEIRKKTSPWPKKRRSKNWIFSLSQSPGIEVTMKVP